MSPKMVVEVRESFGTWLRDQLIRMDVTHSQAAKRIGISRTHLSRILAGDTGIRFETALSIADALNLPQEDTLHRAGFSAGELDEEIPVEMRAFLRLNPIGRSAVRDFINLLSSNPAMVQSQSDEPPAAKKTRRK